MKNKYKKMLMCGLSFIGFSSLITTAATIASNNNNNNVLPTNNIVLVDNINTRVANPSTLTSSSDNSTNNKNYINTIYPNLNQNFNLSDSTKTFLQYSNDVFLGWKSDNGKEFHGNGFDIYSGYTSPGIIVKFSKATGGLYSNITNITFYPDIMLQNIEYYKSHGINEQDFINTLSPYGEYNNIKNVKDATYDILKMLTTNSPQLLFDPSGKTIFPNSSFEVAKFKYTINLDENSVKPGWLSRDYYNNANSIAKGFSIPNMASNGSIFFTCKSFDITNTTNNDNRGLLGFEYDGTKILPTANQDATSLNTSIVWYPTFIQNDSNNQYTTVDCKEFDITKIYNLSTNEINATNLNNQITCLPTTGKNTDIQELDIRSFFNNAWNALTNSKVSNDASKIGSPIKSNDIEIVKHELLNNSGNLQLKIQIRVNNEFTHEYLLTNFKYPQTALKQSISLTIDPQTDLSQWNGQYKSADEFNNPNNKEIINQFLNNKINDILDNYYLDNTKIEIIDANCDWSNAAQGQLIINSITAKNAVNSKQNASNQHIYDIQLTGKIIINGFNTNNPVFTTITPSELDLSSLEAINSVVAQLYLSDQNNQTQINQAIISEVAKNISQINPKAQQDEVANHLEIIKNGSTYNNKDGSCELKIKLKDNFYLENGNPIEQKEFTVKITGFKTMTPLIIEPNNLSIDKNQTVNDLINGNDYLNVIKQKILEQLKDNMFFDNKLPDINNIDVKEIDLNPKEGYIKLQIEINKDYVSNNEIYEILPSPYKREITIDGFKKQLPTEWEQNTSPIIIGDLNKILITDATNSKDEIAKIINDNKNLFAKNIPNNATFEVEIINSPTIDYANGTIEVKLSLNEYYDSTKALLVKASPNEFQQTFKIGKFKLLGNTSINTNQIDLSTIDPSIKNDIASNVIQNQNNEQLFNKIKQAIIDGNHLQNLNLQSNKTITVNDINVSFIENSANNLDGSLKVNITVNDPYYVKNNVPTTQQNPFEVTISGFKLLKETNITQNIITNNNNQQTVEDLILNPDQVKQNIVDALNSDPNASQMFPDGLPTTGDITSVDFSNPSVVNGVVEVTITINKPHVDASGNIVNEPFTQTILINSLKPVNTNDSNYTGQWLVEHWWVILVISSGIILILLIISLIIKRKSKKSNN